MTTATRSTTLAAALSLPLLSGGCFFLGGNDEFIQGDDVRLELPGQVQDRELDQAKIHGDVHDLVLVTTANVNLWVTALVETSARAVEFLDDIPETSRDGEFRVYGPYDDRDGRDLSWLVRLAETDDGSVSELHVGKRGAGSQKEMDLLMSGNLVVGDGTRSGGFLIDFDVVELHPEMKGDRRELYSYAGAVEVTFEREVDSEKKHIDLAFKDFTVVYDGFLDSDTFFSDDTYVYHREADGAGTFHLALTGDWDEYGWSGPEQEKMTLEAAWTPKGTGRTRGTVVEEDGVGDLKHGDIQVDECFDDDGYLTWREITAAYLVDHPDYNLGDPSSCALDEKALPGA